MSFGQVNLTLDENDAWFEYLAPDEPRHIRVVNFTSDTRLLGHRDWPQASDAFRYTRVSGGGGRPGLTALTSKFG